MVQNAQSKLSPSNKLGMTFHRSFTLNRPALSQIIELAGQIENIPVNGKCLSKAEIRNLTSLGSIYVEAMPRYGRGSGLLTEGNCLTEFGRFTNDFDPMLNKSATQWLLHYHLCAVHGSGPLFWNELVSRRFRIGNQFLQQEVTDQIYEYYANIDKSIAIDSAKVTASVFLGTYIKQDGLGSLAILDSKKKESYTVKGPDNPPTWAFAYALVDYWEAHYSERLSINLDDLTNEHGLANLFLMDTAAVTRILNELQHAGFVEVYRSAHPYQLLLLSHDKSLALRNLYGSN